MKKKTNPLKKSANVFPTAEAKRFKEDNWKQCSEDLYFDTIGYKRVPGIGGAERKK